MEISCIEGVLKQNYILNIRNIELFREGGNLAYIVYAEDKRYFLKVIRPPFIENALNSIDIQLYLMKNQFPVIPVILTRKDAAYVDAEIDDERKVFVLYEFIEGDEPDPENTEKAGELIGKLHKLMKNYAGELPVKDKHFLLIGM